MMRGPELEPAVTVVGETFVSYGDLLLIFAELDARAPCADPEATMTYARWPADAWRVLAELLED